MIRAVVPHMRRQQTGRIINISSIAGKLSTPVNGTYSATKFALEALSDALRLELAPFGIQVVLIEPGSIKTPFAETAQAHAGKSSPIRPRLIEIYTNNLRKLQRPCAGRNPARRSSPR